MESTRQLKVAKLIQKELGNIFMREGSNWYGRVMVSVTQVRMSPDLSVAKIYLSIFGTEDKKAVIRSLDEHKSNIRYVFGKNVKSQLRIIPELIFYVDDSVDYFEKIDQALKNTAMPVISNRITDSEEEE